MEKSEKKFKNPVVIATQYAIKLNSEIVATKQSRKEATDYIKSMSLSTDNDVIELVRQNVTEYHINTYKIKTEKVLVAADLSLDIDSE